MMQLLQENVTQQHLLQEWVIPSFLKWSVVSVKVFFVFCLLIAIVGFIGYMSYKNLDAVGHEPSDVAISAYGYSDNFEKSKLRFVNSNQASVDALWARSFSFENISQSIKGLLSTLFSPQQKSPLDDLPYKQADITAITQSTSGVQLMWIGHSSFVGNFDGAVVLLDPVFEHAGPLRFIGKRFQQAVIKRQDLSRVDYIVLSHDHFDHTEASTVRYYAEKDTTFIVPLGMRHHLKFWGVPEDNIVELDWWQSWSANGVTFNATPAQHFSGRGSLSSNKTLWASWVIESASGRVFFSGDTGYSEHFKQIGQAFGDIDLALLENGQYDESWHEIHMLPAQSYQAFIDLGAKFYMPIHWGMFDLSNHTWKTPAEDTSRIVQANTDTQRYVTALMGEVFDIQAPPLENYWWEALR